MKKTAVLLLTLLILVSGVAVGAAGGSATDPLVSLSHLTGTWMADVLQQSSARIETRTQTTYQTNLAALDAKQNTYLSQLGGGTPIGLLDGRYKRGDVIALPTGSGALLLAGNAMVGYPAGGAVVDVTAGQTIASGASLTIPHRYLIGESTRAAITITSDTAVLRLEGATTLSASTAVDYNRLAAALRSAGLFKGTGTGFGSGYDLEVAPTRVVGLVMFLRMLGEEDAALAYTEQTPFADTPAWCKNYVAYAYSKGYTKGTGSSADGNLYFGTNEPLSAEEYLTFVLRALGYTDAGTAPDFTWSTATDRAVALGVLNSAEQQLLSTTPFLRAQVAYISCFALSAPVKGGTGTLLDRLLNSGSLDLSVTASLGGVAALRLT